MEYLERRGHTVVDFGTHQSQYSQSPPFLSPPPSIPSCPCLTPESPSPKNHAIILPDRKPGYAAHRGRTSRSSPPTVPPRATRPPCCHHITPTLTNNRGVHHECGTGLSYQKESGRKAKRRARAAYLVVFAIGVAAAIVGEDAALAVEDIPGVALASFHAVVAAVALQPDGGASGLAQGHAALVVAVGGAADGCNVTAGQNRYRLAPWTKPAACGAIIPTTGVPGQLTPLPRCLTWPRDGAGAPGHATEGKRQPSSLHPTLLASCLVQAEQCFSVTTVSELLRPSFPKALCSLLSCKQACSLTPD